MKRQRFLLVVGLLLGCWIVLSVGLTLADQSAQPTHVQDGWTTVFTETFTNTVSLWTFTETTSTGYQWEVVPYSKKVGEIKINDFGLWSAGGGSQGENQAWLTGTYTNGMRTLAVAGPISLTNEIAEVRIKFEYLNKIDPSDVFSVALSLDGITFVDSMELPVSPSPYLFQELDWTSTAARGADEVYIIFSFASDHAGLFTGPLVDNVVVEVRSGGTVYLPLFKLDPTPTPTLTPTPLPEYVDHFDDPNSGWYTGPAMRLNYRVYDTGSKWVWEEVATMNYYPGEYNIFIHRTSNDGGGLVYSWFTHPVEFAPLPAEMYPLPQNYCVESRAIFYGTNTNPWDSHWGVVIGANAEKTEVYAFQVNSNQKFSILNYHNYVYPGDRADFVDPKFNIEVKILDWGPQASNFDWRLYNTLKAAVRGDHVDIYINGTKYGTVSIPGMPRDRIGLIGATWEWTPTDVHYDYFRYDPLCPEVQ